jgi:hypothetical protein
MQTDSASRRPMRLHHAARIVRDHEANRKLIEDVLGIPLVATWCESVPHPEKPGVQMKRRQCVGFLLVQQSVDYSNWMPKLGT